MEGCYDTDNDGFCDNPYYFLYGGVDYLPWIKQDGWKVKRVPATVDVKPDTLNKKSKSGKNAVTVYIEVPDYDISEIDVDTIRLNTSSGSIFAQLSPTEIGDYDSDGIPDLMVKFNKQEMIAIVGDGDNVEVTISGVIGELTFFEGNDLIKVKE